MSAAAVQAAVGVVQAGIGIAQSISGNKRLKRLLQQREDYKTPDEVSQQFQMAQQQAQTGFSAETLSYLTKNTNNSLTSSFDAARRMGGNANDISSIFSQNVDAIMKTASDSELLKVQKFDRLYTSISKVIEGQDAEFADRRAKQNDKEAAAAMQVAAGNKNLESGINGIMGGFANNATSVLGKEKTNAPAEKLNTMPQTGSSLPPLGTTVTNAPLGGGIDLSKLPKLGSAQQDYSGLINWFNSQGYGTKR